MVFSLDLGSDDSSHLDQTLASLTQVWAQFALFLRFLLAFIVFLLQLLLQLSYRIVLGLL